MPAVYTRTGDAGSTGLFGGSRVSKLDPHVEAYGSLDEANAAIGQAKAACHDDGIRDQLHHIQLRIFVAAAELASDEQGREILGNVISDDDVAELEQLIDQCLAETGPQKAFVVPGRDEVSAALHAARTAARRAERQILGLHSMAPQRAELLRYINRLSDALYALARVVEHRHELVMIEKIVRNAVNNIQNKQLDRYDLAVLKKMAEAAEHKAREMGVPIVFAGVDAGGNLMLVHRMEDSLLGSINLAMGKAFTSAAFKQPTADLHDPSTPAGELRGIQNSNHGRVVVFGGGLPIFIHKKIAGGIGVSGGTVDEDITIVRYALSQVQEGMDS